MAVNDKYDKGPKHGYEARGYSAAYDARAPAAERELKATMAGHDPAAEMDDPTLKNPDHELEAPASMPEGSLAVGTVAAAGPNDVGNSRGDGIIDPQGQQGGTEGGQPGTPAIAIGGRPAGTPLAQGEDRQDRQAGEKGPRPIQPGPLPTDKIG